MIVFIVECPSPYHTPVLNRLHELLADEMRVYYLYAADTSHGWGAIPATHRYVVLDGGPAWRTLAADLLSPALRAVCVYGYRGRARAAAALVARLRRRPLVVRGAANVRDEQRRTVLRRAVKRAYLRALLGQPEIWAGGSANAAYWRMVGLRRHHPIPYALHQLPGGEEGAEKLRADLGVADRFVFAFVGRLEPIKGVGELLRAYDIVRERTPRDATALVLAGRGSLEPEVRDYVDRHRDAHYLGAVPQERLGAAYAAADVFVAPSHREPWGWVVNETLGVGTRVIASVEMAAADDLCTEATGRRCSVGDPDALAGQMLAEVRLGRRRAPRLACVDTARMMADRLAALTGGGVRLDVDRRVPDPVGGPDVPPRRDPLGHH
ncbi:glycosyltransferase [Phytohabitans sp. ZYX-F-186]|uniref:Glycosyltransferase n=1 Tax=Phytohabitans maris TaxID=3071409 RepID=A0ABU0ZMD7_9ACTN|nr:glycosyltransferase [Phytohabitans sp. ZYX-F-186]MDQ7908206.1 glycosyltransferase [Phytohabitans sp. ZYX-F-186]